MLPDDLLRGASRGTAALLFLLDLSAAFDTISHSILLDRLSEVGIGGQALSWFWSFLEGHVQRVQVGHELLAPWTLDCGVPQESLISLMLFYIDVKPLGEVIRRFRVRWHQ